MLQGVSLKNQESKTSTKTHGNNKKERLELLQCLVIDRYIEALERGDVHFRDMSPIVSLLSNNNMVEEKRKSTIEEEIEQRVKEANKRRNNGK